MVGGGMRGGGDGHAKLFPPTCGGWGKIGGAPAQKTANKVFNPTIETKSLLHHLKWCWLKKKGACRRFPSLLYCSSYHEGRNGQTAPSSPFPYHGQRILIDLYSRFPFAQCPHLFFFLFSLPPISAAHLRISPYFNKSLIRRNPRPTPTPALPLFLPSRRFVASIRSHRPPIRFVSSRASYLIFPPGFHGSVSPFLGVGRTKRKPLFQVLQMTHTQNSDLAAVSCWVMGSQVQTRRPAKRRVAEESQGGKVALEFDLNNSPDEVGISSFFHGPSETATSTRAQSVIPVEDGHESANAPICVDDIEDEVVFLSESHQVNLNGTDLNQNGRLGGGTESIDIIHLDSETHSSSAGFAVEEPVTSLTLGNHHVGRSTPGNHVLSIYCYEDLECDYHAKRMKAGSSRENQVEIYEEPREPEQPSYKCAVCLGALVDETSTSCGHIFCQSCIKTAIKAQKKCPTCRKKLNMRNIHRIYFPGST